MARDRSRSADLDERRRHAEAVVRLLPPAPEPWPLTDDERAGIEATVRRYTARHGYHPHRRISWVRSPAAFRRLTRDTRGVLAAGPDRVPSSIQDPVAAAAWQYGVAVDTYRQLQRRT